ncbi:GntR family transcriptional regulator [Microbacterium sp. 1.5R]|uniref:GntR family transcriptional regulator n=1 Tax=Microbacterium sp. 1.5R TaxID=1916917 RepID=UPI0011A34F27|nr:GntR family transcriptional regulator [Microbacterium sp. 1.5R]
MSAVATERLSASERAYATLLDEIQSGHLAAGSVLGEVEQAGRLGVSRTPLRDALRRLAADGLVVQQSPRVTVVADLDASDIRALFEIRRALEETCARLAAQRGDADLFAGLAGEFAHVDLAADAGRDDYYALIARFDAALDGAVANDYIASALRTVRTHLVRVRRMAKDKPARLAASAAEHRTIAEALAARDGDLAAHATHVHLHNALAGILESLDAAGERVSSLRLAPLAQHGARSARSTTGGDSARSTTTTSDQ